jgi:hypothetical protein
MVYDTNSPIYSRSYIGWYYNAKHSHLLEWRNRTVKSKSINWPQCRNSYVAIRDHYPRRKQVINLQYNLQPLLEIVLEIDDLLSTWIMILYTSTYLP